MRCFKLIFFTIIAFAAVSCQQNNTHDLDFGTGVFREPFYGPLGYRPSWLEATLDWPLINSLKPDTVCLTKKIEISFNEEAIRSQSHAILRLVNKNHENYDGVIFYCNSQPLDTTGYTIAATTNHQIMTLSCKVLPIYSTRDFFGYVTIEGTEIDEVNNISLSSNCETISNWHLKYKLGFSYIWIIWLLLIVLVLVVLYLFIKFLVVAIPLIGFTSNAGLPISIIFNLRWKTGWSTQLLKYIRSSEEAQIYIDEGLKEAFVGGKKALIQPKIDGSAKDSPNWRWRNDYNSFKGWTNKDRAGEGYAPLDVNGDPYELHHVGQDPHSPLAELTHRAHHSDGNFKKLHTFDDSKINRVLFEQERSLYWQNRYKSL